MDGAELSRMKCNPQRFRNALAIPTGSGVAMYGAIMADFQRDLAMRTDPCMLAIVNGHKPPYAGLWDERVKGGSKDSDHAVNLLFCLVFANRPLRIQVAAGDQQQASEVRMILEGILRLDAPLNRLLHSVVDVQRERVVCERTEGVIEVMTSDARSSHGSRPDIVFVNELSHHADEHFAATVMDNCAKVSNAFAIIATNAGQADSWQHRWRELHRADPQWIFHKLATIPPWIDPSAVEAARRRNPPARFRRLWQGEWVLQTGSGLDMAQVERAIKWDGPPDPLPTGWDVVLGLDLGVSHDHAALVGLACDYVRQKLVLVHTKVWKPEDYPGGRIRLGDVEAHVLETAKRFRALGTASDPWQAERTLQYLADQGVPCFAYPFTSKSLGEMAQVILRGFANEIIELYREPRLLSDLARVSVMERPTGGITLRFEHSKEGGHSDLATAFCIAARWAEGTLIDTLHAQGIRLRPTLAEAESTV